jgi:hypothetical protein
MQSQLITERRSPSSRKLDTRRTRRRKSKKSLIELAIAALKRIGVRPPPSWRPS